MTTFSRMLSLASATAALCFPLPAAAKDSGDRPHTVQTALVDAEQALDSGRFGDAEQEEAKLRRSRLTRPELDRLEVVTARCALATGKYEVSEKLLAKVRKRAPENGRLNEWYGQALAGGGKESQALEVLGGLAKEGALKEGDSYWTLAQLERTSGKNDIALEHARTALKTPFVFQSNEVEQAIQRFITEMHPQKK